MTDASPPDFTRDLVRWSETLSAIARTGLGFTESLYERERFEEVLHVAADIKGAADEALEVRREQDHFVQEWLESVGEGVPGYVTPKVAIGAVVGNEQGEIEKREDRVNVPGGDDHQRQRQPDHLDHRTEQLDQEL